MANNPLAFTEMGVLCATAYHQPIDRVGLADIFDEEISANCWPDCATRI
ncbi:hypothetical protein [Cognatiyoonia sp. IB215182]|nr:hypothetical protein [Cognatiyoonia sp. IB215182]MDX8355488.1 hypothetical protein [Cognatiyoonia sp. IB215182]